MELRPREIAKLLQKALRRDCLRLIYKVLAPQLFLVHLPEDVCNEWLQFIPLLERETGRTPGPSRPKAGR